MFFEREKDVHSVHEPWTENSVNPPWTTTMDNRGTRVVGHERRGDVARPVVSFNGGGNSSSMTRGSGWGGTKIEAALDTLECCRGVGDLL
jgi:hypothetical protein